MADETIEQLRKRFDTLNEKRIRAEANLATATNELQRIQEEAKAQWGTDDLAALEAKLQEIRAENEKQRANYQKHLEGVEQRLLQVETQFKTGT